METTGPSGRATCKSAGPPGEARGLRRVLRVSLERLKDTTLWAEGRQGHWSGPSPGPLKAEGLGRVLKVSLERLKDTTQWADGRQGRCSGPAPEPAKAGGLGRVLRVSLERLKDTTQWADGRQGRCSGPAPEPAKAGGPGRVLRVSLERLKDTTQWAEGRQGRCSGPAPEPVKAGGPGRVLRVSLERLKDTTQWAEGRQGRCSGPAPEPVKAGGPGRVLRVSLERLKDTTLWAEGRQGRCSGPAPEPAKAGGPGRVLRVSLDRLKDTTQWAEGRQGRCSGPAPEAAKAGGPGRVLKVSLERLKDTTQWAEGRQGRCSGPAPEPAKAGGPGKVLRVSLERLKDTTQWAEGRQGRCSGPAPEPVKAGGLGKVLRVSLERLKDTTQGAEGRQGRCSGPAPEPAKARGLGKVLRVSLERLKDTTQWAEGRQGHCSGPSPGPSKAAQKPARSCRARQPATHRGHSRGPSRPRGCRPRGRPLSLLVPSGTAGRMRHPEEGQGLEAIAPALAPAGLRGRAGPSTGESPGARAAAVAAAAARAGELLGKGCEAQVRAQLLAFPVVSLRRLRLGPDTGTRGGAQMAPPRPAGLGPTTPRAPIAQVPHTGPEPQAAPSPGGAPRKPGLPGEASSSACPGLGLLQPPGPQHRKRKLPGPDREKGQPAPTPVTHTHGHKPEPTCTQPRRVRRAHKGPASSLGSTGRPRSAPLRAGSLVWHKPGDLPFWPAVVTSVSGQVPTARVLLIEAKLCPHHSGLLVPLHRLKPLDCEEKGKLLRRAIRAYGHSVTWCLSLVAHYRQVRAHKLFRGSFLDYYVADASYPIRRALHNGPQHLRFPEVHYTDLEDSEDDASPGPQGPRKRLLPDRDRAAHDRAMRKLVNFIVNTKGADAHLLDVLQGRRPSKWLMAFLKDDRYLVCVQTYLEDDDQLYAVASHLQRVYSSIEPPVPSLLGADKVRVVLEVLLPEAMIYSIAALEDLDYQGAEEVYQRGPPMQYTEKVKLERRALRVKKKRVTLGGSGSVPRRCLHPR